MKKYTSIGGSERNLVFRDEKGDLNVSMQTKEGRFVCDVTLPSGERLNIALDLLGGSEVNHVEDRATSSIRRIYEENLFDTEGAVEQARQQAVVAARAYQIMVEREQEKKERAEHEALTKDALTYHNLMITREKPLETFGTESGKAFWIEQLKSARVNFLEGTV